MTDGGRPATGWLPVAIGVLLVVAVGVFTNVFTSALPADWTWARDWKLMAAGLALVTLVSIVRTRMLSAGRTIRRPLRSLRYGHHYRRWVRNSRRTLDAKGLATIGPSSPELDAVFVNVALMSQAPSKVSTGVVGGGTGDGKRRSIWEFLDQRDRTVLAVLGAPGGGKTTLLSHVARETAATHREKLRPVPVLLQLRDHASTISGKLSITLPELIRATVPPLIGTEPAGWWEKQLRAGRCVVLFDGLDEVAEGDTRRAVVSWINAQVDVHAGNDFVVTSRPHGYRDSFVRTRDTVQVLPFTQAQVQIFLRKWYEAAEPKADVDTTAADRLFRQLCASPALRDLAENPLLLTMIAYVHRYRGELPDNRATLYSEVCDVMLFRRDQEKGVTFALSGAERLDLLGRLACSWMLTTRRDAGRRALLDELRPWLAGITPEDFLAEMEATGLLVEQTPDLYAFAHLTFQEFLAARHLTEHAEQEVPLEAIGDSWWRETTLLHLLYSPENDPDSIVLGAVRAGTARALSFAYEIVDLGFAVSAGARARLDEVLRKGVAPESDATRRRIAVDVLVDRLVSDAMQLPGGGEICRHPVSNQIYDLFRPSASPSSPDDPARGMWRSEALAFLGRLNEEIAATSGGSTFRLPTYAELRLLEPPGPVWTSDAHSEQTWPDGWSVSVTGSDLREALAIDLRNSSLLAFALFEGVQHRISGLRHRAAAVNKEAANVAAAVRQAVADETYAHLDLERLHARQGSERIVGDAMSRVMSALQHDVNLLITDLQCLPSLENAAVSDLSAALAGIDLGPAHRIVSQARPRHSRMPNLRIRSIDDTLQRIRQSLAGAPRLVTARPPGDDPSRSPVDHVLGPGRRLDITGRQSPLDDRSTVELLAEALLPEGFWTVYIDLDALTATVDRLADPALALPPGLSEFDRVLQRLARAAEPVVTRKLPITPARAASVRVPALFIARTVPVKSDQLHRDLVELAAAMCVLERRAMRRSETLHLVRD
ncbi:NACHT domain-containing protein [Actinoplanes sp. NBC_00393]|uniref:NACHT domain-containing protein n=1 Tax=Actinoplanes sp. NBC_00393 TaxID=2975953 RepID=UPI002E20AE01